MTGKTIGVTSVMGRVMDDIKMREADNPNDEKAQANGDCPWQELRRIDRRFGGGSGMLDGHGIHLKRRVIMYRSRRCHVGDPCLDYGPPDGRELAFVIKSHEMSSSR